MLQFQPLYVLWLEFQNTHWRPQRENVILGDVLAQRGKKCASVALCRDMPDALQKWFDLCFTGNRVQVCPRYGAEPKL